MSAEGIKAANNMANIVKIPNIGGIPVVIYPRTHYKLNVTNFKRFP